MQLRKFYPKKLQTKLSVLILGLLLLVMSVIGFISLNTISVVLEEQIGLGALRVSQTVSLIPEIWKGLEHGKPKDLVVQGIAERIRKETGAEFVVVGDKNGRRFSHPVPDRLGKLMVGGDNRRALEKGESYVSKAVGTLGPSIRGKVPIFNRNGNVIGLVSVGYLQKDVRTRIRDYQSKIFIFILVMLGVGVFLAIKIANEFKRAIFGLEPSEIASLLQERTAMLNTVREGIIAVNAKGLITMINSAAYEIVKIEREESVIGKPVKQVFPQTKMMDVLHSGKSQFDQELIIGDSDVIANRIPIFNQGRINGVISSFRKKNELDLLFRELSQVKAYSELLRAQTHEYSNKLYTISGLIQIGDYRKAIDLISNESSGYQELIHNLMRIVSDPVVAGVILGKYSRAQELKVQFKIDIDSSMKDIPDHIQREKLVTIIGNLLDNAFEAALKACVQKRLVRLSMTDLGNDLIFEVDDSGKGLDGENHRQLFEQGYSTKKEPGSGMGLFLLERALNSLGGSVNVNRSELGGLAFTVIIPKEIPKKR